MSGFDKEWLALRENADRDARSSELLGRFSHYIEAVSSPAVIMDIGCGTGSTYRTLSPLLPADTKWRLLDYENDLLEEAARRVGNKDNVEFHCQDLNHLDEALLDGVSLVTASALFDLCSAEFCERFIERLSRNGMGLYAALNYDGVMTWSIEHPLDQQVTEDFNLHQKTDKGFGPALGPDASGHLAEICNRFGYSCKHSQSPWRLGPNSAELQAELLNGLVRPVLEIGNLNGNAIQEWLEFRLSNVSVSGSLCIVGHTDLLALPRR